MQIGRQTPIAAHGLIGNSRTAALVSRDGSIAWCCFPRFDSPSCFTSILDPENGGDFFVRPSIDYVSSQHYLDDTNLLVTLFKTKTGTVQITDFFFATSEARKKSRLLSDHELLRMMNCTEGEVPMMALIRPRGHYGQNTLQPRLRGHWGLEFECSNGILLFQSSLRPSPFRIFDEGARASFTIRSGENVELHLLFTNLAPAVIPPLGKAALARRDETALYWREWAARCNYQGEFRSHVIRSALALKLLNYAPSGTFIAAPTTSLPEHLGGVRNWDYRYAWLRDASISVRALIRLGYQDEALAYANWLLHATRLTRPKLQVMYDVYGRPELDEHTLPWLSGYAGSRPVRVGNAASKQFQLDVYGEVADAVTAVSHLLDHLDHATRSFILGIGNEVKKLWGDPDEGIWEVRSGRHHHVHSKVMAWVALNRVSALSRKFGFKIDPELGSTELKIRDAIEKYGFDSEMGSYTRAFGVREMDAAVAIMPFVGYCDARAPRMRSTLNAIEQKLSRNDFIYRYLQTKDGLPAGEGSFGICNFWVASVRYLQGDIEQGDRWLKSMLRCAGPLQLWSEEIDPDTRELLGNYPQAFTHIGLINSLLRRQRAFEQKERQIA